jgi:hypothetical protein
MLPKKPDASQKTSLLLSIGLPTTPMRKDSAVEIELKRRKRRASRRRDSRISVGR